MTAKYDEHSPDAIRGGLELLKSPEMQAAMHEIASLGKAFGESVAPMDANGTTQHYKDSFSVVDDPEEDRARAILRNDDDDAVWVEYGTGLDRPRPQGGSSPRHSVMHRARDVMGGS